MEGRKIKERIDFNNKLLQEIMTPNIFTLNNKIRDLIEENQQLQAQCPHKFKDGYCIYCYKEERED